MTNKQLYCKFYIENKCKNNNTCKFIHEDNICKDYFFRNCNLGENCKYKHIRNKKNKIKKINTESFEPNYDLPDINIILAAPNKKYSDRDVILAPNIFDNPNEIYEKLINEMQNVKMKMWHGDTHLIADDHTNWKNNSTTFNFVVEKLSEYFNVEVKATRFNWYNDPTMWKPYHHDAAAIDPKKAENQNLTIGVSFGGTRSIGFEHATTRNKIFIPLETGMTYAFGKDVNIEWRHGIPPLSNLETDLGSRISIILWGKKI